MCMSVYQTTQVIRDGSKLENIVLSTLALPEFTSAAGTEIRVYNGNIILICNKSFGQSYIHPPLVKILNENSEAFNVNLRQVFTVETVNKKDSEIFRITVSEISIL